MRQGFYALASVNGAPLNQADLEVMGLSGEGEGILVCLDGFAARAYDPMTQAIDVHRASSFVSLFAGFLDEEAEVRAALGASTDASPAALAGLALERYGREAPRHLLGEWTLLHWDAMGRALTLLTSEALRDPIYGTERDGLIALCPHAMRLTELSWVGRGLDTRGLAARAARAGLRHGILTGQTMWKGIWSAQPGTLTGFSKAGRTCETVSAQPPVERWTGSYDEAVEALQGLGRRIVRQHLERYGRSAFQLSGGLDSTVMTSWGAFERGPGREMFCISSMAPPGSGLADERRWSMAAAAALGIPLQGVWGAQEANLFRPEPAIFAEYEGTPVGGYHAVAALERAAIAGGASAMIGGSGGEMHISNGFQIPETRSWLRLRLAAARDRLSRRREFSGWPAAAFHLRFSREVLDDLPREWAPIWRKGTPRLEPWKSGDAGGLQEPGGSQEPLIGLSPTLRKVAGTPTASAHGLRHPHVFRDLRLMRLTAGLPAMFLQHEGQTRPLARSLLRGRVPDSVRLRVQGGAFSPDYVTALKAQAPRAKTRLPMFRETGIGRWLDLAWLEQALDRLAAWQGEADYGLCYEAQGTAGFAEFLLWLLSQGVAL